MGAGSFTRRTPLGVTHLSGSKRRSCWHQPPSTVRAWQRSCSAISQANPASVSPPNSRAPDRTPGPPPNPFALESHSQGCECRNPVPTRPHPGRGQLPSAVGLSLTPRESPLRDQRAAVSSPTVLTVHEKFCSKRTGRVLDHPSEHPRPATIPRLASQLERQPTDIATTGVAEVPCWRRVLQTLRLTETPVMQATITHSGRGHHSNELTMV